MNCEFVVGQKVVCVDNYNSYRVSGVNYDYHNFALILNKIYTIESINENEYCASGISIRLKEIPARRIIDRGYDFARFRPLSDIRNEKFQKIINNIPKDLYKEDECIEKKLEKI